MHDKLVIIGAGGHGRVCAEIAELCGYKRVIFLDDRANEFVKIDGRTTDFVKYLGCADFFVGIGNNSVRERIINLILQSGGNIITLIHPFTSVSPNATVSDGTVIMAGSVINSGAVIGKGVIVNTCASIDHDCLISDYSHISVGAHLAGTVRLGKNTVVGAGATIINNVDVCENCIIGAGATVIHSLFESGTYIGVPVRKK